MLLPSGVRIDGVARRAISECRWWRDDPLRRCWSLISLPDDAVARADALSRPVTVLRVRTDDNEKIQLRVQWNTHDTTPEGVVRSFYTPISASLSS